MRIIVILILLLIPYQFSFGQNNSINIPTLGENMISQMTEKGAINKRENFAIFKIDDLCDKNIDLALCRNPESLIVLTKDTGNVMCDTSLNEIVRSSTVGESIILKHNTIAENLEVGIFIAKDNYDLTEEESKNEMMTDLKNLKNSNQMKSNPVIYFPDKFLYEF